MRCTLLTVYRRLVNVAFTFVCAYGLLKGLDKGLDILEEAVDPTARTSGQEKGAGEQANSGDDKAGKWETVGEDGEEEEEEEEDVESLLFFPTGLSRPKPRTFYKGTDPEWKEFQRISEDKELKKRIESG